MKKIVILIIVLICFTFCFFEKSNYISATTSNTINDLKNDLSALKAKKAANDSAKKKTQSELNSSKQSIYNSQQEIDENQKKVDEAKKEIENLKGDIAITEENMKSVLSSYQLTSVDNAYLEYVFDATSITDLIYRYSIVEQIVDWQDGEITKYEGQITKNEELQVELAEREVELNKKIASLETKVSSLGSQLSEFSEISMDMSDEIKTAQEYITYLENMGCKSDQDIDDCLGAVTDTGFRYPLTKGTISSSFGYRTHPITGKVQSFHNAIDIAIKEGTDVYASAAGVVGKIIRKASCGGNSVYIWHTVNGKKYTTQYTHLLKINVSLGDKVTNTTIIGLSGGSSTKSYDRCTTGGHLHFAMANGHYGGSGSNSYSTYSTYLTKCFDPKAFLGMPKKWTTRG